MGRFGEKVREARLDVVSTCIEERCWVYWEKDPDDGPERKTGKA